MEGMQNHIREWAATILAVGAVLLTAIYAVTKESRAADEIRDAHYLATRLTEAAATVSQTTLTREQIEDLKHRQEELANRVADMKKPGCIAAELTETARKTGLLVGGIQPFEESQPGAGRSGKTAGSSYRILVEGTYGQIGEYMDACESQRLPARTRQFRITRVSGDEADGPVTLRAEIVVEPFCPTEPVSESGVK